MNERWQLSELAVITVPGFSALVEQAELTVPKIPTFAEEATTSLMRITEECGIEITAPPVFVYTGAGTGAEDLFTMQVAFPVAEETKFEGNDRVSLVSYEAFKCARALIYRGAMMRLGEAYPVAMNALKDAEHVPMEQSREVYKYWVGYDSPENVIEIQMGIR